MKDKYLKLNFLSKILTCLFVLLSIGIKFYRIDARSFSFDELYSVVSAIEPSYKDFLENWVFYDSNPPLYYFILRLWLKIFPSTEFWARLLSVFFVLLASFFFVRGIKKRFENNTWFYLLILICLSYGFLFFAQEARAYAILLFFTCFQILFFIDSLNFEKQKTFLKSLVFFTVYSILSSYTHYTGFVFSSILFLYLSFLYRKNFKILKLILFSILVSIIAGLLWLKYFLFILELDKSFIINQDFSIIKEIMSMLFFGHSTIEKYITLIFLIYLVFLFVISINDFEKIKKQNGKILFIGIVSTIIIFLSPFIKFFFQYRHFIVFIPIILLSISLFLSAFDRNKNKNIYLIIAFLVLFSQGYFHHKNKREEWSQVVKYIIDNNNNENENIKVIILGEPWEKSHKKYLKMDPRYLNISIRREKMYKYYFKRFTKHNNFELVVIRPKIKEVQSFIENELKRNNKVYILSHAGEFDKKLKKMQFNEKTIVKWKYFYFHEVCYLEKNSSMEN